MKTKIEVYESDREFSLHNEKLVKTIERVVFNKGWSGNFIPYYCRYKRKVYNIMGSIDSAYMHGYDNDAHIIVGGRYEN